MLISIQEARYEGDYRVWLRFNTGESGVADLRDLIFRHPVAQPLRELGAFQAFFLDEWPTLAWVCGYDIAPETLYERATGKTHHWEHGNPAEGGFLTV